MEHDDTFADQLGFATEKLQSGEVKKAHQQLLRLIRKHRCDPQVIFLLALARKRLGYDVSADALFAQALDRGYIFPPEGAPFEDPKRPGFLRWTDCSGTVHLVLQQKPRRISMTFVEFGDDDTLPPADGDQDEDPPSPADAQDEPTQDETNGNAPF